MIPRLNSPVYLYIEGEKEKGLSISLNRTAHLESLGEMDTNLQVSLHNNGYWSKWDRFPMPRTLNHSDVELCADVHRRICDFEIVCESDYPLYSENVESIRFVGSLLESLGYKCHYYYSGGKGIHIHIFIDYSQFEPFMEEFSPKISKYIKDEQDFKNKFIRFEREYIFGLQTKYILDEQLIGGKHLIRSELSMHKNGCKSFLGYTFKDITPFEYQCNLDTMLYPEIATFANIPDNEMVHRAKWTKYVNPKDKLEQFMNYLISQSNQRRISSNTTFNPTEMRYLVKQLYERTDKYSEDGKKRVMFVLVNELKNCYPKNKAREMLLGWNDRLGKPFEANFLDYHLNREIAYKLTNKYIEKVIKEVVNGNS